MAKKTMTAPAMGFRVQAKPCVTCIYHPDSAMDIAKLERDVADHNFEGYFVGYRVCHHSDDVCCHGFWSRHKDQFTLGQVVQRLGLVEYVTVDTLSTEKPIYD